MNDERQKRQNDMNKIIPSIVVFDRLFWASIDLVKDIINLKNKNVAINDIGISKKSISCVISLG